MRLMRGMNAKFLPERLQALVEAKKRNPSFSYHYSLCLHYSNTTEILQNGMRLPETKADQLHGQVYGKAVYFTTPLDACIRIARRYGANVYVALVQYTNVVHMPLWRPCHLDPVLRICGDDILVATKQQPAHVPISQAMTEVVVFKPTNIVPLLRVWGDQQQDRMQVVVKALHRFVEDTFHGALGEYVDDLTERHHEAHRIQQKIIFDELESALHTRAPSLS